MTSLNFLRSLDKLLGNAACRVLLLHKKLVGKGERANSLPGLPKRIKRIVIIKLFGFGSILIMTPILRALKKACPTAKISLITLEQNKAIVERICFLDETLTVSPKNLLCSIRDLLRIVVYLRKEKPDVIIDFEFFVGTTAILTYLSKGRFKVGFGTERIKFRNRLYDKTVAFNQKEHILKNFCNFVKPELLQHVDERIEKLKTTMRDEKYVSWILKEHGIKRHDKIICININAGELAYERRWSRERFISVAKKILDHYSNAKIIFIGGKQDEYYVSNALRALYQGRIKAKARIINLSGKLSLPQLQLVLMKAKLLLTNDSGPMHLAAATGIKEICLFGPESPTRYAPLNKNSIIVYKRLKCSPCMDVYNRKKIKCHREAECMRNITVNEVFEKVKLSLDN